jgi:hypothetical protein
MDVGDAGIWVGANVAGMGVAEAGMVVFVGRGAGLVEGATVTDRSHAEVTMMIREMFKRGFFSSVLYMAEFPFVLDHSHQE